ncbi:glutaminyl-peptide cyclotransferase [Foetidibacter luteolus]|uniref:glutaminyl-peptide cyclotransferase n=1 Tax=Foetidibacter luteolus TaxID=2608880 RepID=UPI00129A40CB|nr:glutaminyl-peptide cyclotransferase [Foetidibacter luteolus]
MNQLMTTGFSALLLLAVGCGNDTPSGETIENSNTVPAPPVLTYSVVKVYPHDTTSYIQGLIWYNNSLYEGTGNYGESRLMKVDINSGKASQAIDLDKKIFGEGITILNDKIYQLTWKEHKVFVYDTKTFKKLQEFEWPYEGWGITHNGKELIISTGSNSIYFVEPATFKILRTIGVSDNYGPAGMINELEYVNGFIYANQYETDYILKINPQTGTVEGKLDLENILQKNQVKYNPQAINVLNGIAYDSAKNSFLVTGKWWPALFEIKVN